MPFLTDYFFLKIVCCVGGRVLARLKRAHLTTAHVLTTAHFSYRALKSGIPLY